MFLLVLPLYSISFDVVDRVINYLQRSPRKMAANFEATS